ncbi:hypothetical protein TNCV_2593381 [Trichonephila clavipes]|nr:hypothetical protein TNCV_2593381 [Trichonephila clavipes]
MQNLRPTLIYACPIWGHAAHFNIKQIEIAQNLILRTITKADWYIRNEDIRSALNLKTLNPPIGQNGFFRPTREASKMDCTDFSAFK